jgi:hypothetical protein
MRIGAALTLAAALLAGGAADGAAQARRDRPILIFTVSGAYIDGAGLWNIADQPITDLSGGGEGLTDHLAITRSIKRSLGAAFSGSYFKGAHFGITGEGMLLGLGYEDACRIQQPSLSALNVERCASLERLDHSAAAVAISAGAIYRIAPGEFISPFARASAGLLINNQSPIRVVAESDDGAEFTIYEDQQRGTRLRPAFTLGVGTTIAVGRAYHLRWEIRDNILGIQRVTAPAADRGEVPPHNTAYKHLFSLMVGLDVILERRPGRRY